MAAHHSGFVEEVRTVVCLTTGKAREARTGIPWETVVRADMWLVRIAKCVPTNHRVGESCLVAETRTGLQFVLTLQPLADSDGSKLSHANVWS
jgi:hypothetical protein